MVMLKVPLNFNYQVSEPAKVKITTSGGDVEWIQIKEAYELSREMEGSIYINKNGHIEPNNGFLEIEDGQKIDGSYGFGYFRHKDQIVYSK